MRRCSISDSSPHTLKTPRKTIPKHSSRSEPWALTIPRARLPNKLWLLILEEHQKILEEHQKMTEERQRLSDEKRAVIREREVLAQERKKLKYTEEKSRQLDVDIEKRRRKSLNR